MFRKQKCLNDSRELRKQDKETLRGLPRESQGCEHHVNQPDNYKEMAADLIHDWVGGGPTHKRDSPSRFCSAALFAVTILLHRSEIFWPHSSNNRGRQLF